MEHGYVPKRRNEFVMYTPEGDVDSYCLKYWEYIDANGDNRATAYWEFPSTGMAYDAVQVNPAICIGDILIIPTEGVVGLADAWPLAVTAEKGKLHCLVGDLTWEEKRDAICAALLVPAEQVDLACEIADTMGFPSIRDYEN